jgi:hypothetical protein
MVIHFTKNLQEALHNIQLRELKTFPIHTKKETRTHHTSDTIISIYGDAKWAIIHHLNHHYNLSSDLHNWILKKEDEPAHFINEAGSNTLSHSEFKSPSKFHLWLGNKGFIIGVEQLGTGFNALEVHENKIKENKGAAFDFFRACKGSIFFDDKSNATVVYLEHLF